VTSASTIELVLTQRLACERLRPEHAQELPRLLLDPRVAATLWPGDEPPTEHDVEAALRANCEHWELHGFGMWLLRDRASGEMVGRGGLQYTYSTGLDEIEVGWAIVPERWSQGLATELAWASIRTAFGVLELLDIVAMALPENRASRRVMEKTGFVYERDLIHAGLPHVLYRRLPERA
jgi:ribosomal-protein-alanine N-acetyltransferase